MIEHILIGLVVAFFCVLLGLSVVVGILAQAVLNDRNRELAKEGKFMDKWGRIHLRPHDHTKQNFKASHGRLD